ERVPVRGDPFFGKIRIGSAFQQQFNYLHVPAYRRVLQRGPATDVVRVVVRDAVYQGGVRVGERTHPLRIALGGRHADVDVDTARHEVSVHVTRSGDRVGGNIAPATIEVIAVREVNRPRAVLPARVDVGTSGEQLVDEVDLPGHHGPMNRLIGARVSGVQ